MSIMKSPTRIVWEAAGEPEVASASAGAGRCYICCGEVTCGVPVQDWLGSSFVDQNRARCPTASHVCEACAFVMSRISPVPGRPPGKCSVCEGTLSVVKTPDKGKGRGSKAGDPCPKCKGTGLNPFGGNWRSYSHCWEDGHCYVNASKGEKPTIRAFLEREHTGLWFAAIADSGQKHVLPFTMINPPGRRGIVLMDEVRVSIPEDQSLTAIMTDLLTRGTTKEGIETGRHGAWAFDRIGDDLQRFEREHGRNRGSPWFGLALWLAQRDNEEVQRRMAAEKEEKSAKRAKQGKAAKSHDRSGAGSKSRVPAQRARKRAETLGATRDADAGGGENERERGRVRDVVLQRAPTGRPGQAKLPGFE